MRKGGVLEDYLIPEIPDEPAASPYALWTLGLPTNLVSGVSYTADFLLVLSTNELAAVSGIAQLSVVRQADGVPHPNAQIAPAQITFVQGACRTNVLVTASNSLAGYVVAVTLTSSSLAPPSLGKENPRSDGADSSLILVPVIILPNSPPTAADAFTKALEGVRAYVDTPGWSLPIPNALPEVSGTFGEWRGHKRDGVPHANTHAGLDLVANAGATVSAARGGIVRINDGRALGRYITVDHLDGWYSRYLHLSTTATVAAIGSYVNRGDPIGVVGTTAQTGLSPHLHFELRSGAPGSASGQPGIGVDPIRQTGMFAVRTPQLFGTLYSVGVTPNNPAAQLYQRPT